MPVRILDDLATPLAPTRIDAIEHRPQGQEGQLPAREGAADRFQALGGSPADEMPGQGKNPTLQRLAAYDLGAERPLSKPLPGAGLGVQCTPPISATFVYRWGKEPQGIEPDFERQLVVYGRIKVRCHFAHGPKLALPTRRPSQCLGETEPTLTSAAGASSQSRHKNSSTSSPSSPT